MSLPGRAKQRDPGNPITSPKKDGSPGFARKKARDPVMTILPKEAAAAQKARKFMLHRNNARQYSNKSYAFYMPEAADRH